MTSRLGKNPAVTVLLECAHTIEFVYMPPLLGEDIWCVRCRKMSKVFASEDHWFARCTVCTFGRDRGLDEAGARLDAVKHARKRGHVVRVRNGREVVSVVGATHDTLFGS